MKLYQTIFTASFVVLYGVGLFIVDLYRIKTFIVAFAPPPRPSSSNSPSTKFSR